MSMGKETKDTKRTEMASAVNLFAHPVAGAAAWSAFSFGLASQAFGFWIGTLNGVGSAAQSLLDPVAKHGSKGETPADQPKAALSGRKPAREVQETAVSAPVASAPTGPRQKAVAPTKTANGAGTADNLKAIAGVGPKLEQVLNGLGVRSYEQIASWTDKEIASIEETLGFEGRIVRDDWVGQATTLARAGSK